MSGKVVLWKGGYTMIDLFQDDVWVIQEFRPALCIKINKLFVKQLTFYAAQLSIGVLQCYTYLFT